MTQVFKIEMFVARNQFLSVYLEGIYKEVQKVRWHAAVVYKTAYSSYFAFLHFFLHLFHKVGGAGSIVYQYIGIPGDFNAITGVHIVSREDEADIGLYDILNKHQVIVVPLFGKFDETGHFAIRHLHYEILHMIRVGLLRAVHEETYCEIKPVVPQE